MHMRDAVLNHKDKRHIAVVLDGGGGDQDHVLQRIHQQAGIHKLVGKERVVFVVEERAQFQRAGGGVDLVVDSFRAFPMASLVCSERSSASTGSGLPLAHLLLHLADIVFRNGEDHGDGLQSG